jgi:hypothetical protein
MISSSMPSDSFLLSQKFDLKPHNEEESKKILVDNINKKENRKKYRETCYLDPNNNNPN